MDVKRLLVLFFVGVSLSACAEKSSNSVFPENTALTAECAGTAIRTEFLVTWEDGRITRERAPSSDDFSTHFIEPQLQDIRHVEFNKRIRLHNDGYQTADISYVTSRTWGQDAIEAEDAWNQSVFGEGVVVAVTDTVVDLDHVQLAANVFENERERDGTDGIDDDGNGVADDLHGWDFFRNRPHQLGDSPDAHGSHVAGIIAADHGSGTVRGIAPKAKVLPVAFLTEKGEGDLFGAIKSLDYAVATGAKIINASWGGPHCSQSLRAATKRVSDAGVMLVVASGNDGKDLETSPDYPAAYVNPLQITVASIRSTGYMSRFSNTSFNFVHVVAPGEEIYSTVPRNRYASMSGTSMAAPFVTGAAALVWSHRPKATALQVRQALFESVEAGNFRVETQGLINIRKALLAIRSKVSP